MIEIPLLEGKALKSFDKRDFEEAYCKTIRSIFFEEPIWNGTPEFKKTFPFGFLLYSNANPELVEFMGQESTWSFLDTITREKFFIFSARPEKGGKTLSEECNESMLAAAHAFDLGSIVLNPCLIVFDFHFSHKKGKADWEHIYDANIGKFHVLELPNLKSVDYLNFFRTRLGVGIRGLKSEQHPDSPATAIAYAIRNAEATNLLKKSGEGLLKGFLKDFAAALPLLKWRPGKLGQGE